MTELTEEMKSQGWKPIEDIVNEPIGIYQLLEPRPHGAFREHDKLLEKHDLMLYYGKNPYAHVYYRRLIPVTSDIHISRADAKLFEGVAGIIGDNKASAIYAAQARLRAQLEGK